MLKAFKLSLLTVPFLFLTSCFKAEVLSSVNGCSEVGAEVNCSEISNFSILMKDDFSRDFVVDETIESVEDVLKWRKIIDDMGRISDDKEGNNVNAQVTDESELGPAADGSKYLTMYGRQGGSVHNIYLVTETLNLEEFFGDANVMGVKFKYLPINLEQNEYLKLEICNDTAEACGVGEVVTSSGLNSSNWKTVYETSPSDVATNFNGRDHLKTDYRIRHIPIYLESLQRKEFVIRFNFRMDEGFINNDHNNNMEDGILLDSVQITAMQAPKVDDIDDEEIDLIIDDQKLEEEPLD